MLSNKYRSLLTFTFIILVGCYLQLISDTLRVKISLFQIRNSELKISAICAKFGGAAHDSYVWRSWSLSSHLEEEHNSGKTGWLLGDSGYPQKPWLMTPVLHTTENTPEAHYTNMHVRTRICVEQCIGLLIHYIFVHYSVSKATMELT